MSQSKQQLSRGRIPNEGKKDPKVFRGAEAQVPPTYSHRNDAAFAFGKQHHLARILVGSNPITPLGGAPGRSRRVQRTALRDL